MIFVTIGTHPGGFERLVRHMDKLAEKMSEKIVIQRGFTKYVPKNCESFDFTEEIDEYYKKARIVIAQSATSLIEFALKYNKPVITVPRQKKFREHINDHQVEFGEFFAAKTGIKCVININELTPEILKDYNKVARIDESNLKKLKSFFGRLFAGETRRI